MNGAKLNRDELVDIIFFALKENNINIKEVRASTIKTIIRNYAELCVSFQKNYVNGELDTFKRAACLLVAINKIKFSSDKKINASIALDAAYKMCEKPYWNIEANYNIPKKMEEVDFKKAFANEMKIFMTSKNLLIASLIKGAASPLNYYQNLEILYNVAINLKHNLITKKVQPQVNEGIENDEAENSNNKKSLKEKLSNQSLSKILRRK
ncbi:MAG: hypothetical protein IJ509_03665 [Bacilli bacterium]|nr:hypothetical protein [Bacilli bacterium]